MAKSRQHIIAGIMDQLNPLVESCDSVSYEEDKGFSETQLKIAKRFIELMGSADKAREIVDKVDECQECLGIVDDHAESDSSMIDQMAGMLPSSADLPMGLSNLYNSSASNQRM